MSQLLFVGIKTLDNGVFQFDQNVLIPKKLEATGMEHCNWFPTPNKVEAHLGTDDNFPSAKIDRPN